MFGEKALKSREYMLRTKYRLSLADYDSLLKSQGGVCSICQRPPKEGSYLHVDHDHSMRNVRGLLCSTCNTGLGAFQDNIRWLAAAIVYLEDNDIKPSTQLQSDWLHNID